MPRSVKSPRDSNLRRLRSNLRRNPGAMAALAAAGVDPATIETFAMGLREAYSRADGRMVEGVLSYALADDGGRRRFGCVNLDGVTSHGEHRLAWSPGRPITLRWSLGAGTLLVCGSPMELWQLGQAAERARISVTLVASSRPDEPPADWSDRRFWDGADRIVVTGSVSAALRRLVVARAPKAEHAPGVSCPADVDRTPGERHDEWLEELLVHAVGCAPAARAAEDEAGDFAAEPIPVRGGFDRGHLLHPFEVERRREEPGEAGGAPRMVYSMETLVLRGDGAVLEPCVLPAPRGTPAARRVHALSDGTRIVAAPRLGGRGTWSLPSIKAFISARAAGVDPCARPAAEVFAAVHDHLASRVILPDPADLHVAAAFVIASHMFRIFDALPIVRIAGEKGSGKTELATAIAALAYGGCVMGQGSASALVRLAGECGGLVVLDDAEGLGAEAGGFGELAQCLKLGYKASSARKPVVLGGGRVEVFDFYGPRVLTSTRDVDPILGSRCITIRTAPCERLVAADATTDVAGLRDELHVLAMSRAADVARRYRDVLVPGAGREAEIRAPLVAVSAELGGLFHRG